MRHILANRHLSTLAHFATSNVLLAFDYDGTLASIASDPRRVRLRPTTRRLLVDVARCYPCVVISGRGLDDITERMSGIPVWHVLGNHGLEPWNRTATYAARVREWVARLEQHLPPCRGLIVENKTYSVAIHYRHVRQKDRVLKAIHEIVLGLRGSRTVGGKQAVNLLPQGAPHKGMAMEHARQALACDAAVYVGDDETDEDVFTVAPPDRLLSIRVGATPKSAARYYLKSQPEIDVLLQALVRLRPRRRAAHKIHR